MERSGTQTESEKGQVAGREITGLPICNAETYCSYESLQAQRALRTPAPPALSACVSGEPPTLPVGFSQKDSHSRDELVGLLLKGLILLLLLLDEALVGLGVVRPALLLEEILHLGHVVGHQDLTAVLGSATLQCRERKKEREVGGESAWRGERPGSNKKKEKKESAPSPRRPSSPRASCSWPSARVCRLRCCSR